jgi:hypothetical protein
MKDLRDILILAILAALAWFGLIEPRLRVDPPQPVQPAPQGIQVVPVLVQPAYATPVIQVIQPTNPPPVNVMPEPVYPTQGFERGGIEAPPVATGIVGEHSPGTNHHRTP